MSEPPTTHSHPIDFESPFPLSSNLASNSIDNANDAQNAPFSTINFDDLDNVNFLSRPTWIAQNRSTTSSTDTESATQLELTYDNDKQQNFHTCPKKSIEHENRKTMAEKEDFDNMLQNICLSDLTDDTGPLFADMFKGSDTENVLNDSFCLSDFIDPSCLFTTDVSGERNEQGVGQSKGNVTSLDNTETSTTVIKDTTNRFTNTEENDSLSLPDHEDFVKVFTSEWMDTSENTIAPNNITLPSELLIEHINPNDSTTNICLESNVTETKPVKNTQNNLAVHSPSTNSCESQQINLTELTKGIKVIPDKNLTDIMDSIAMEIENDNTAMNNAQPNTILNEFSWPCPHCKRVFHRQCDLDQHIIDKTQCIQFTCGKCTLRFPSKDILDKHIKECDFTFGYFCQSCQTSFRYKKWFDLHQCHKNSVSEDQQREFNNSPVHQSPLIGRGEVAIKCLHCKQSFFDRLGLRNHLEQGHCIEKSLTCRFCQKVLQTISLLRKHERRCARPQKNNKKCPKCSEEFKYESQYNRHVPNCKTDSSGDYRCIHCKNVDFPSKRELRSHVRKCHADIKCPQCHEKFKYQSWLTRHMQNCKIKSDNTQIIPCPLCGTNMPAGWRYNRHVESCQQKNASCTCKTCNKMFTSLRGLRRHARNCGKTKFKCTSCQGDFDSVNKRNSHAKSCGRYDRKSSFCGTLSYKCKKCNEVFSSRRDQYYHQSLQHPIQSGSGGNVPLQEQPFSEEDAPWNNGDGNIDEEFRNIYSGERRFILAPSRVHEYPRVYNLPVNGSVDINTLMDFISGISETENHRFRLNVDFGLMLYDTENRRYRYYRPLASHGLLGRPFRINSKEDLKKLKRFLQKKDLIGQTMQRRPNSKFVFKFITNFEVIVYPTGFLLGAGEVPPHIKASSSIKCFDRNGSNVPYNDNLCAFRCLAYHLYGDNYIAHNMKILFHKWRTFLKKPKMTQENFLGIDYALLPKFEECFEVNVSAYSLDEDREASCVFRSLGKFPSTMYLNVHENHLSYITKFDSYARVFQCSSCGFLCKRADNCKTHEQTCGRNTRYRYPGGFYHPQLTIFEEAEHYGIHVPPAERFSDHIALYDFEAWMDRCNLSSDTGNLRYTAEHKPISFSVISNVPGYEEAFTQVNPNATALVSSMKEYLTKIAVASETIMREKWDGVFQRLDYLKELWRPQDADNDVDIDDTVMYDLIEDAERSLLLDTTDDSISDVSDASKKIMHRKIVNFAKRFEAYTRQLTVGAFNGSHYDLQVILKELVPLFGLTDKGTRVIKQGNKYVNIKTQYFNFIDIARFLPPHTSYASFLRAFDIEDKKSFFPFDWLDSVSKLDQTHLPPIEEWYSVVKGKSVLDDNHLTVEENYEYVQSIWRDHNMSNMKQFLIYYNQCDVIGFLKAVCKMVEFYQNLDICIFKTCISVPGCSRKMLFQCAKEQGAYFSLMDSKNADLYMLIKSNLVGGLSCVFHRRQKANETYVDEEKKHLCQKVIGYDMNA